MGDLDPTIREQIEATKRLHGITTHLDLIAPIPFQWNAWYGEWDGDPEGRPDIGNGPTELIAITDLIVNYDAPEESEARAERV